jgi:hypothetical protein
MLLRPQLFGLEVEGSEEVEEVEEVEGSEYLIGEV